MSFKTIVVHLDDGPHCATRVELAASARHALRGARSSASRRPAFPTSSWRMNSAVPDGLELIALVAGPSPRSGPKRRRRHSIAQCKALGIASHESRVVVEEAARRHRASTDGAAT